MLPVSIWADPGNSSPITHLLGNPFLGFLLQPAAVTTYCPWDPTQVLGMDGTDTRDNQVRIVVKKILKKKIRKKRNGYEYLYHRWEKLGSWILCSSCYILIQSFHLLFQLFYVLWCIKDDWGLVRLPYMFIDRTQKKIKSTTMVSIYTRIHVQSIYNSILSIKLRLEQKSNSWLDIHGFLLLILLTHPPILMGGFLRRKKTKKKKGERERERITAWELVMERRSWNFSCRIVAGLLCSLETMVFLSFFFLPFSLSLSLSLPVCLWWYDQQVPLFKSYLSFLWL